MVYMYGIHVWYEWYVYCICSMYVYPMDGMYTYGIYGAYIWLMYGMVWYMILTYQIQTIQINLSTLPYTYISEITYSNCCHKILSYLQIVVKKYFGFKFCRILVDDGR